MSVGDDLPVGAYEQLITTALKRELERLPASFKLRINSAPDAGEVRIQLTRHVAEELSRFLKAYLRGDASDTALGGADVVNELLGALAARPPHVTGSDQRIAGAPSVLNAILSTQLGSAEYPAPLIPLSQSALVVNDEVKLAAGAVMKREIESSDRVDLICAFVNHHGVRIFENEIGRLIRRGGQMRLITTTYMGATQKRALDLLDAWGVQIKVVYELPPVNTKLHAKAWLFYRNSGFHTAAVGSSNLSHSALMDGLEWNVRLSQIDAPQILDSVRSVFERYWSDPSFEDYRCDRDGERLARALGAATRSDDTDRLEFFADIRPWPHQTEILEALEAERERHGKRTNLVVAATGTGKTIVAALDYKRLREARQNMPLLFVAHRREILEQARSAFRHVLRDGSFGELWVEGRRPVEWEHVFASIQTLANADLATLAPDRFAMVIIDEFHHAEARTYRRLLDHVRPDILLGLTATPERTDGVNVADFFGGSTVEIRLWDALSRGLLCPFQYFGVSDDTDLSGLRWDRGSYLSEDLDEAYVTNGDARAALVARQVRKIVTDVDKMRALGFCASVKHARFMTRKFNAMGIASACLVGDTPSEERIAIRRELRRGELRCIFTVDIFNEGVDLPELDTVLFLRPTESATVYVQQLGRGLRLCENKPCLTVLDFIGQQHARFRFDLRYRAMTGLDKAALEDQIHSGFPALPAGCHIELDRQSADYVLQNLRQQISVRTDRMVVELRDYARSNPEITVGEFLQRAGIEPEDLYRRNRWFTRLQREAQLVRTVEGLEESRVGGRIRTLLEVDDRERTTFYSLILREPKQPDLNTFRVRERRLLYMLAYDLLGDATPEELPAAMERIWTQIEVRREIADLMEYIDTKSRTLSYDLGLPRLADVPIQAHAFYTRDQIMAAFGSEKPAAMREGVKWFKDEACDVLLITLRKSETEFSPTTRYDDYLISPTLLHWESQSTTSEQSATGQRYINHDGDGSSVLVFVRERKQSPYCCLGPAHYVSHESERPMRIRWRLDRPVPAAIFADLKAAAG